MVAILLVSENAGGAEQSSREYIEEGLPLCLADNATTA